MSRRRFLFSLSTIAMGAGWARPRGEAASMEDGPDPQEELNQARALRKAGNYEAALAKHIWFHENALKHDPALAGVRLSFALSDWVELGKLYPRALVVLNEIRDRDTKAIRDGKGTFLLFLDVSAINRTLDEPGKTVDLFKAIDAAQPALAKQCYQPAETDLVVANEYKLCSRYIPDASRRFENIRQMRLRNLELGERGLPNLKDYAERNYRQEVARLDLILRGAGRDEEATKVRKLALDELKDPALRKALEDVLKPAP